MGGHVKWMAKAQSEDTALSSFVHTHIRPQDSMWHCPNSTKLDSTQPLPVSPALRVHFMLQTIVALRNF